MEFVAKCPKCGVSLPVSAADAPAAIKCGRCGAELALSTSAAVRDDRQVDICPICEGGDFYIRKDFDPKLGLTVVTIGALVSGVLYWLGRDFVAYSVLAIAVLVDLAIYGRLKDVTVCYRCHAEFRGAYLQTAPAFDLHTADVLEREYEKRTGKR